MAIVTRKNVLNLQPGITAPVVVHISQGDHGYPLTFHLVDGDEIYIVPYNAVVSVTGTRIDGSHFGPYACTFSGETITFNLPAAVSRIAGSGIAEVTLSNSNETVGSANFVFMVEECAIPNGVTYSNDPSVYEDILTYVQSQMSQIRSMVGTPLVAATASAMTDTTKIYVYTGSQDGYTNGNWYYYNGSSWVSGGIYNAVAFTTDTTLSIAGAAADAKETGDAISAQNDVISAQSDVISVINNGLNAFSYALPPSDLVTGFVSGSVGSAPSFGSQTYYCSSYYGVSEGKSYTINTVVGSGDNFYGVYWLNSSGNIVKKEMYGPSFLSESTETSRNVVGYTVTAPAQAKFLLLHSKTNVSSYNVFVAVFENNLNYSLGVVDRAFGELDYYEDQIALAYNAGTANAVSSAVKGATISFNSLTYWGHDIINVIPGELYKFTTRINKHVNGVIPLIYWLDDDDKVIDFELIYDGSHNPGAQSGDLVRFYNYVTIVPNAVTKMVVICETDETNFTDTNIKLIKITPKPVYPRLPAYYHTDNYWNSIIAKINAKTASVLNGVSFVFMTDPHFAANALNSKYMIADLLDKTRVPFCICGGDFPTAYGTTKDLEYSIKMLNEYREMIGPERFYTVRGNHDFTIKTDSAQETGAVDTGKTYSIATTYDAISRDQEIYVYGSDPTNMAWYIDIPGQKTRIVGLNSSDKASTENTKSWDVSYAVRKNQVDWLLDVALAKEGYRYIFVGHIPADSTLQGNTPTQYVFQEIFKAMKNKTNLSYTDTYNTDVGTVTHDFTGTTSTAICYISGHCHCDQSHKDTNFLGITTTCDAAYLDDGFSAKKGTITEQAFDVYVVNYDTGKINAIRCGRGNDREFTY